MGGKYILADILALLILKEGSWNWISFRFVITDNLAMEGFKAEELVHSVVFLTTYIHLLLIQNVIGKVLYKLSNSS